jgi:uncharacterized membrane-anchored protein YitT (DUF2179 family)
MLPPASWAGSSASNASLVGTFGYMFDIPLLILSVVLLGAKLGSRTIAAALITPLLMNIISKLVYPTKEALEALDPD